MKLDREATRDFVRFLAELDAAAFLADCNKREAQAANNRQNPRHPSPPRPRR